MTLSFQAVTLDGNSPDREATLVFRDGRLFAVVSCLSDIHADWAGTWYIEAAFADLPRPQPPTFETLAELEEWLASHE